MILQMVPYLVTLRSQLFVITHVRPYWIVRKPHISLLFKMIFNVHIICSINHGTQICVIHKFVFPQDSKCQNDKHCLAQKRSKSTSCMWVVSCSQQWSNMLGLEQVHVITTIVGICVACDFVKKSVSWYSLDYVKWITFLIKNALRKSRLNSASVCVKNSK